MPGLALGIGASMRLCGIGPALAGTVGAGWAFARPRDGNQDVDVPMLAPTRSRCRLVEAQEGSGEEGLSRCALGGERVIASNARSGPAPLAPGG